MCSIFPGHVYILIKNSIKFCITNVSFLVQIYNKKDIITGKTVFEDIVSKSPKESHKEQYHFTT